MVNNWKKISEQGSMMVEALAMLGLITMVTPVLYKKAAERTTELQDINTATQLRALSKALDGYMKDNASETTFYRYITSDYILLNKSNEIVYDESYCRKNFCYSKLFVEPSMVDMSEKTENK